MRSDMRKNAEFVNTASIMLTMLQRVAHITAMSRQRMPRRSSVSMATPQHMGCGRKLFMFLPGLPCARFSGSPPPEAFFKQGQPGAEKRLA